MRTPGPVEPRFWAKVDQRGTDECWVWTGFRHPKGYGYFRVDGRSLAAHRVAYELCVAPIPDGLTIDHLCRNRACVNPAHLEPVTMIVNVLRGEGPTAENARKTHCIRGHPFDEENTYWFNGGRTCRICQRAICAAYRARVRASRRAA